MQEPQIIKLKDPKTGQVVPFKWDKPTPPTDADLDEMYQSIGGDIKPSVNPPASDTFLSMAGKGLSGLKDFASSILQAGLTQPGGYNPASAKLGEMVVQPAKELITPHAHPENAFPLAADIGERIARSATALTGANYEDINKHWTEKNFPALAGDLVVPAGMGLVAHKIGGIGKDAPEVLPKPKVDILPPEIQSTKLLNQGAQPNLPDIIVNELKQLNAPEAPRGLLPAIGETNQTPRFFGGRAGIGDTLQSYPNESNIIPKPGGDILPEQLGQVNDVGPIIAAERTVQDVRDPAQLNPAFRALVPDRYNGIPMVPHTNPILGISDKPIFNTELEHPEGGRIVNPPRESGNIFSRDVLEPETSRLLKGNSETPSITGIKEPLDIKPEGTSLRELLERASKQTGDSTKVLDEAVNSKDPTISKLAYDYAKEADRLGPFSFAGTRLKALGSAGVELYRKGARFAQKERFNLHDWAEPFKASIMKLSKDEQQQFGNYAEGKLPIPNERVQNSVNQWKVAAEKSGLAAEKSGMMIELANGKKVPFARMIQNYWPHRLTAEALKNLPSKIDEMVADGVSRKDANRIIDNARKYGELILPQQHQRLGARFPYETHAKSGLIHLESMAKSVARTEEFGRYDLAKGGELGIKDLIESTSNPERAYDIMKRVIGRDEKVNKSLDTAVRVARTAVSWARLQNYGLSAIVGNQLPNMLRANGLQYLKSLGSFIGQNRAITDGSAAMIDISHGIFEQTRKLNPMKLYGGQLAEDIVRGQAAGIGDGLAKTYFRELKKDPTNWRAKKELFELILEPVDKVLTQDKLSDNQLRMAAGRNAEISQGLTNPLNMPKFMSEPISGPGNAMLQSSMIFKKQATIQTKMIKDAIKKNPVKATAILVGMSQISGGIIGGLKSTTIGATRAAIGNKNLSESISNEYEHRADYVAKITHTDNQLVNRSIDRALQSWALGVVGDMLYLALDNNAWKGLVAGPVVGALDDIIGNLNNPKQLGREVIKMAPIPGGIGTGAAKELLPPKR